VEDPSLLADPNLLFDGPSTASTTIALAHGAGAAMDSPFMNFFAAGLAEQRYRVVRFEFPYMASYRKTGQRKPPDREAVLRETWLQVVALLGHEGLVIGGKSMGGRIASLVADQAEVAGLVCLGYPFHPVDKADKLRVEHLQSIKTPTLILQGERDPFGSREEVAGYDLSPAIQVKWLEDGDHSFKPRKSSGRTERQNWEAGMAEIATFLSSVRARKATRSRRGR
jgi:predicted alpha/beta-hydrolase family hydrolase